MNAFAGIKSEGKGFENSAILLQSIPYDGTSTWGKGADKGFEAFITASQHLEIYDIETDSEVIWEGVHILPEIAENRLPELVFKSVYGRTKELLETGKFLTFFGGEHSVSIGIIKAFYERYPGITILQIDAHSDLRETYMGSPYNHACALYDASNHTNLVQVGIRSMDGAEKDLLPPSRRFLARDIHRRDDWMEDAMERIGSRVYITFDLDAFDPSIMPSTGTPEPGGLLWDETLAFLRRVFNERDVLGFDIVELAPIPGFRGPDFLAARLYYKMLTYKFAKDEK